MIEYTEIDRLNDEIPQYKNLINDKVLNALNIEYTYESNKIEGNTLTLRETALVIEKGLTIGGKPLNEHLEAINHAHAIDFIKELATTNEPITERDILQIHSLILQGINRSDAGKYRDVSVMISGSRHTPPPPLEVPEKMKNLLVWYNENREQMHPVELASEMHERLVFIHPFVDGNGRTSRLLMNLILLKNNYPIAILKGDTENRMRYYNALETASLEDNREPFKLFIREILTETLNRILNLIK